MSAASVEIRAMSVFGGVARGALNIITIDISGGDMALVVSRKIVDLWTHRIAHCQIVNGIMAVTDKRISLCRTSRLESQRDPRVVRCKHATVRLGSHGRLLL